MGFEVFGVILHILLHKRQATHHLGDSVYMLMDIIQREKMSTY